MDPDPRTPRELAWMVRAKRSAAWDHTAALLAQQANLNRDRGAAAIHPDECNPYAEKRRKAPDLEMDAGEGIRMVANLLGAKVVQSIPGKRIPAPRVPGWNAPAEGTGVKEGKG